MARSKKPSPPEIIPLQTYGRLPQPGATQLQYDLLAFAKRLPVSTGAPPRDELFRKIADTIVPGHFIWDDWALKIIRSLCPDDGRRVNLVGMSGCSGSAKSFTVGSFAAIWWLAWPNESSVTLVSTTMNMLRRRIWSEVQRVYSRIRSKQEFGNFIQSRTMWQAIKGDDKHAIIGQAVEEGSIQKVADNIKGVHTRRQMLVIDEGTSIPQAIFAACENLHTYPEEFILVVLGNAWSRLDQHGLFCEPLKGWSSVSCDSEEWTSKPFIHCGGEKPTVLIFNAEKSPNIIEGRVVNRHLPTKEKVESARANSGGGNSPAYWSNYRGFWPPEGIAKSVWTETELERFSAFDGHDFNGVATTIIGALDPARDGGDKRILRFARMGEGPSGVQLIVLDEPQEIQIDVTLKENPIAFQIAAAAKKKCLEAGCLPSAFGMDDSSESSLCDVLCQSWSHLIHRIMFQSSPSQSALSLEDARPANEVCRNKRAEMYLFARSVLRSGQLRGVDNQTAREMCSLEVDDTKPLSVIQSKKDYRATHAGNSPDYSDCLVMLLEVARRRGFQLQAIGQTKTIAEQSQKEAIENQSLYEPANLWQPEEDEMETDLIL